MPVWVRPCCFEELRTLLREGRVEWGRKPADNAMEFAEAVASLGTDRGIDSFQTSDLVHFAERLVLPYKPRMIVLHVGGNDVHNGIAGSGGVGTVGNPATGGSGLNLFADPVTVIYVGEPKVGEFMKKRVFEPGRTLDWRGLTKYATGAELSPKAFAADFGAK